MSERARTWPPFARRQRDASAGWARRCVRAPMQRCTASLTHFLSPLSLAYIYIPSQPRRRSEGTYGIRPHTLSADGRSAGRRAADAAKAHAICALPKPWHTQHMGGYAVRGAPDFIRSKGRALSRGVELCVYPYLHTLCLMRARMYSCDVSCMPLRTWQIGQNRDGRKGRRPAARVTHVWVRRCVVSILCSIQAWRVVTHMYV
jgi:hypothetical protein